MVDSDHDITNLRIGRHHRCLHACNDSQLGPDVGRGQTRDTKAVIPDGNMPVCTKPQSTSQSQWGTDPKTMGSVSNIGLMAQKLKNTARTIRRLSSPVRTIVVETASGEALIEQPGKAGDIFRMCQVKDAPIQDWVKLGVKRARVTGNPAVFWLDENRAELIKKVKAYLTNHDTDGLTIEILAPVEATTYSLERIVKGQDTISVTAMSSRDLDRPVPHFEVGTSAKMLSIVPLMNGGGLFETGAGGFARSTQQLQGQNYLRWDSLGEFLALAVSLDHVRTRQAMKKHVYSAAASTTRRSIPRRRQEPTRRLGGNYGSHSTLALLGRSTGDTTRKPALRDTFTGLAASMRSAESTIVDELIAGKAMPLTPAATTNGRREGCGHHAAVSHTECPD